MTPAAADAPAGGDTRLFAIGEAAARLGVSERALRYYEEVGLLTPSAKTAGGQRRYSGDDLARVTRIRELQQLLGFNLDEIRVVLTTDDGLQSLRSEYHTAGADRQREMIEEALVLHAELRGQVDAKLSQLDAFRADIVGREQRLRDALHDLNLNRS